MVAAEWAEQSWVKVERERSDRTLTRICGADRWGWSTLEVAGGPRGGARGAQRAGRGVREITREAGSNGGRCLIQKCRCSQFCSLEPAWSAGSRVS
jgi:hypothetical protein